MNPTAPASSATRPPSTTPPSPKELGSDDLGFRVSSHLLRKSLATDLAWKAGIEDSVRRRFMGHRAGDDVFGRIYTLDHPEVAPLAKVAAILDDKITASITTLLTPTTRTIHWGSANPLFARADHVTSVLADAGWLVEPGDPDDPLCDAKRVAEELGIVATTARRWMTDGTIPSVVVARRRGVPRRYSRLSDVWAHRDQLAGVIRLPDLAEQLGVRYHEIYRIAAPSRPRHRAAPHQPRVHASPTSRPTPSGPSTHGSEPSTAAR